MAKSTNLSLEEGEPEVIESTASVVEENVEPAQEEVPIQDINALAQTVARLEALLNLACDRITLLEQKAHTEHQIEIGPNELQAIGNALKKQMQQTIIDHLKEHLGIAPPAIKGS